jgi:hypothetical protein
MGRMGKAGCSGKDQTQGTPATASVEKRGEMKK